MKSINQQDIRCYPNVHQLKDKLAGLLKLKKNNIFMNNGSSENIRIFYEAFAVKNMEVIITNPCYPMHKIYAQLQNSIIKEVNYNKDKTIDYNDIINNINDNTCCIVLANPNSPVGDIISLNYIEEIIIKANENNIPILIKLYRIRSTRSCIHLLKYQNLLFLAHFQKHYVLSKNWIFIEMMIRKLINLYI